MNFPIYRVDGKPAPVNVLRIKVAKTASYSGGSITPTTQRKDLLLVSGCHGCAFVCGAEIMQVGSMPFPGDSECKTQYPLTHGTTACQQDEMTVLFRIEMKPGDSAKSLWDLFQKTVREAYVASSATTYPEAPAVQPPREWVKVGTWVVPKQ